MEMERKRKYSSPCDSDTARKRRLSSTSDSTESTTDTESTSSAQNMDEANNAISNLPFNSPTQNFPFHSPTQKMMDNTKKETDRKRKYSSPCDSGTARKQRYSTESTTYTESTLSAQNMDETTKSVSNLPYSSAAQKMMEKMGYKAGKGLGKYETGRVDIIEASKQRGHRGLGLNLQGLEPDANAKWDESEKVLIRQDPDWIPTNEQLIPSLDELNSWFTMSNKKETIDDEFGFCEQEIVTGVLENKTMFDSLSANELFKARTRANPYETIRGAMFQNRAAMKMAEMDASFDYMFTNLNGSKVKNSSDLIYFADICAGPGGFSEYVLWRDKWHAKGFGFTLRASWANDFKLEAFTAGTPETFDCHYGVGGYKGDGDIFNDKNLVEFGKYVKENTDNQGVHFVMADGGFSVEGKENIQEILSKQLYLCQFICALSILRIGGHFVCKLFDVFTPFSAGLVYLMYRAFEQVCIFKPVTSRPANSERYIICKSLRKDTGSIHDYMFDLNIKINNLKGSEIDIRDVVPISLIKADTVFFDYLFTSNNAIGARQILGLRKLITYIQNTSLSGPSQAEVRKQCLAAWSVPQQARANIMRNDPDNQFEKLMASDSTSWMESKIGVLNKNVLEHIKSVHNYKCVLSGGDRVYLFSLGRQAIFQWNPVIHEEPTWKRLDNVNLELPRFTLLDAELVLEFIGDGRGQRKMLAVHILDVIYIGEEYVGDKPISDRIKYSESFAKALSKPCRNDIVTIRAKTYFTMSEIPNTLNQLEMKQMKKGGERKSTFTLNDGKYFVPLGIYFYRRVQEPWNLQYSRSSKRLYFYNTKTLQSIYEGHKTSIADVKYCTITKLFWELGKDSISKNVSQEDIVNFVSSKV